MQEKLNRLKTGIARLDEIIGDFFPGELMILKGENIFSDEQSNFLFFLTKLITLNSGLPGILFARFFQPSNIYYRLIGSIAGVSWEKIYDSKLDETEIEFVRVISKQVHDLPLYIKPMVYLKDLFEETLKSYKDRGIKIIYLDGEPFYNMEDSRILKHYGYQNLIIQELKQFAKELNIAIVITFACKEKEWSYKACKEIAKSSDIILNFDKWQYSSIRGMYHQRVRVLKTQNGKTGTYDLLFMPTTLNYEVF